MSQFMNLPLGPLYGGLLWSQWSRVIEALSNNSDGAWYVYYVGAPAPTSPPARRVFPTLRGRSEPTAPPRMDRQPRSDVQWQ